MDKMFKVLLKTIQYILMFFGVVFLILVITVFVMSQKKPPKPEIEHGEFPFKLTYEVNEETKIIEDTIVCQFEGFENYGEGGNFREWSIGLKSGEKEIVLLNVGEKKSENDYSILRLIFNYGNANYYMGDKSSHQERAQSFDDIWGIYQDDDGEELKKYLTAEKAYELYGIKLISWECAPRIRNSFEPETSNLEKIVPIVLVLLFVAFVFKDKFKPKP